MIDTVLLDHRIDGDHLALGGDGGMHVRNDAGETWMQTVMPLAQLNEIDVDMRYLDRVDVGTRTPRRGAVRAVHRQRRHHRSHPSSCGPVGDGMAIHSYICHPNIIYLAQNNGNLAHLDLRTWTRTELQPDPAMAAQLKLHEFRWDWSPPFIVSSTDPNVLFVGANYVFRCEIGAKLPVAKSRIRAPCVQLDRRLNRTNRIHRWARAITATVRCSRSPSRR